MCNNVANKYRDNYAELINKMLQINSLIFCPHANIFTMCEQYLNLLGV